MKPVSYAFPLYYEPRMIELIDFQEQVAALVRSCIQIDRFGVFQWEADQLEGRVLLYLDCSDRDADVLAASFLKAGLSVAPK